MKRLKMWIAKVWITLTLTMVVFFSMLFAMMVVFGIMYTLRNNGIRVGIMLKNCSPETITLATFAFISLIIGTFLSAFLSRRPLKPVNQLINGIDRIANGEYDTRLNIDGPEGFRVISTSFNHMAEELGSVEMLRSDFVNNFSHEFKTPIVSIEGFAKLLLREDLTEEEKKEYLEIIVAESERLAKLATNVLQLSKIEKQAILSDAKRINLSEQIRLAIALLDKKWSDKHIDIDFDCDEIYYIGSSELLKQIWINLIDNAIKFSPEYGSIDIKINELNDEIRVSISDQGCGMAKETADHIFDKFYQGDTSHSTQGNGLGLTIASRIAILHGGSIRVDETTSNGTRFLVVLPLKRVVE